MAVVTITSLHLYPVKGCAPVDVDTLAFDADGLIVGDRAAMLIDASNNAFVSQRHVHELAQLHARDAGTAIELSWQGRSLICERPTSARLIRVTVWDDTFAAEDGGDEPAAWISAAIGWPVRLVWLRKPSGRVLEAYWAGDANRLTSFADLAPVLLTNVRSLDDLNTRRAEHGLSPIEMLRFRPNIVVDGLCAFGEDQVEVLRSASGATLRLIKPCARCNVIEHDPSTGRPTGDEVLRSLADFRAMQNRRGTRGIMFGQNAIIDAGQPGIFKVGDTLTAS